jgi:hypothetical protein
MLIVSYCGGAAYGESQAQEHSTGGGEQMTVV